MEEKIQKIVVSKNFKKARRTLICIENQIFRQGKILGCDSPLQGRITMASYEILKDWVALQP